MSRKEPPISGKGYFKSRGGSSQAGTMVVEVNRQVTAGTGPKKAVVNVRLSVAEGEGDRPLTDLREHGIELSLEQGEQNITVDTLEQLLGKLSVRIADVFSQD